MEQLSTLARVEHAKTDLCNHADHTRSRCSLYLLHAILDVESISIYAETILYRSSTSTYKPSQFVLTLRLEAEWFERPSGVTSVQKPRGAETE